eukprot:jgi/Mesen1/10967/ME000096S10537
MASLLQSCPRCICTFSHASAGVHVSATRQECASSLRPVDCSRWKLKLVAMNAPGGIYIQTEVLVKNRRGQFPQLSAAAARAATSDTSETSAGVEGAEGGSEEGAPPGALEVGSAVVVVEAPLFVKTAEPMPMMKPNDGIVKVGDAGRIISRRPMKTWAVRFSQATYLLDQKYIKLLEL